MLARDADLAADQRRLNNADDQKGERHATTELRKRQAFVTRLAGVVGGRLVRGLLCSVRDLVRNRFALREDQQQ